MNEYRVEELARITETTVRNVRAYQDRGLLPPPQRQGRVAYYDDSHVARLKLISGLLARGYTLASIKDLLGAWDSGQGLDAVVRIAPELLWSWPVEPSQHVTLNKLVEIFGKDSTAEDLAAAISAGILLPEGQGFRVSSMRELAVGAELRAAGLPLPEVFGEIGQLREDMERIAGRFVQLIMRSVLLPEIEKDPEKADPEALARRVSQLEPLAQAAVDAEFARAMRLEAARAIESTLAPMRREPRSSH